MQAALAPGVKTDAVCSCHPPSPALGRQVLRCGARATGEGRAHLRGSEVSVVMSDFLLGALSTVNGSSPTNAPVAAAAYVSRTHRACARRQSLYLNLFSLSMLFYCIDGRPPSPARYTIPAQPGDNTVWPERCLRLAFRKRDPVDVVFGPEELARGMLNFGDSSRFEPVRKKGMN